MVFLLVEQQTVPVLFLSHLDYKNVCYTMVFVLQPPELYYKISHLQPYSLFAVSLQE
jgi:hypothetical protein